MRVRPTRARPPLGRNTRASQLVIPFLRPRAMTITISMAHFLSPWTGLAYKKEGRGGGEMMPAPEQGRPRDKQVNWRAKWFRGPKAGLRFMAHRLALAAHLATFALPIARGPTEITRAALVCIMAWPRGQDRGRARGGDNNCHLLLFGEHSARPRPCPPKMSRARGRARVCVSMCPLACSGTQDGTF